MPDTLIKMKTGTIAKMEQKKVNGQPEVPLEEGSVYFAVDTTNHIGKIVYDVSDGHGGVDRIVMGTQVELADEAILAYDAEKLQTARAIDGVAFNGTVEITHYGTCNTAANVAAKTVSCDNFVLDTGSRIIVKFNNTNTATAPTLNVNNTGAKPIYYRGNPISPDIGPEENSISTLVANGTYEFIYDKNAISSNNGA